MRGVGLHWGTGVKYAQMVGCPPSPVTLLLALLATGFVNLLTILSEL
jgi:hypothetical protein